MSRVPLSKQASSFKQLVQAPEKSCVNKPDPSPELHPQSSSCGGKPRFWSAGVSMASLLLMVQTMQGRGGDVICAGSYREEHTDSTELLLQNISLFLFKPCNEPVFTSAFCYCSLFSWNLFLFNTGGPKITANFLQGICSLKHTVWHFSFSSFFYFFFSFLSEISTESVENSVVAFECCKVNAENYILNGIIKADVSIIWMLLKSPMHSNSVFISLLMYAPF